MLLSTDKNVFKKEVEILRRVSRRPHTHLIALLATYRYREHYHLVFPWAEDNLETFWRRTTPQQNDATARWLAEQCRGLASGLATIHQYRRTSTDSIVDVLGLAEPQGPERCHPGVLFCRHGDIKPQNILWFPGRDGSKGVLKICDFGVAEFNLNDTVPRTKRPPATPMYEPPEAYVPRTDAVIGTSYDVWGLACVFLEFLSWHLGGWEYVSNFLDRRLAVDDHIPRYFDTGKLRVGTFFLIEGEDATGALRAAVKASVHEVRTIPTILFSRHFLVPYSILPSSYFLSLRFLLFLLPSPPTDTLPHIPVHRRTALGPEVHRTHPRRPRADQARHAACRGKAADNRGSRRREAREDAASG